MNEDDRFAKPVVFPSGVRWEPTDYKSIDQTPYLAYLDKVAAKVNTKTAIRITPLNLDKIAAVNGGVKPIPYSGTYFVDDTDGPGEILSKTKFFKKYDVVDSTKDMDMEFVEVREKNTAYDEKSTRKGSRDTNV